MSENMEEYEISIIRYERVYFPSLVDAIREAKEYADPARGEEVLCVVKMSYVEEIRDSEEA